MGKRTGNPRGRPKGARSTRTREREAAVAQAARAVEAALPEAFQGDAHALLMAVYKDVTQDLDVRIDAAKAAIGYEKPRLQAIDAQLTGKDGGPLITRIERVIVDPSDTDA